MAMYLLLRIEDDNDAAALVSLLHNGGSVPIATPNGDTVEIDIIARALYKCPTKFCDCQPGGKKQERGFTRSKKYAWWVHADCGKPTKLWASGEHFFYSLGKNLLPVSAEAPEWRGEGVHGHNWDPETKQWIHHETGEVWNPGKALADLRTKYGFQ